MAKLQCRTLDKNPETFLPCSPFSSSDRYKKSSLLGLKRVRFSCTVSSQVKVRAGSFFGPLNMFSYGCVNTYGGGFNKRLYSRVGILASKAEGNSGSEDVDLEASGKLLSPDSTSLPSSSNKKVPKKRKPRAKKSLKQKGDVSSSSTAEVKGSEETSQVKKSDTQKTEQRSLQEVQLKINGNASLVDQLSLTKSLLDETFIGKSAMEKDEDQVKPREEMSFKPLYPPTGKSVVVVESVAKAKVIQGYLGDMYEVLPSHGHMRDLAARSGSVRPDDNFSLVWEVPSSAWTYLKSIKIALSGAQNLILASDPDHEGEATAWHIIEMLQEQVTLHKGITVARVVYHEITETSIKNALTTPREIDANLVNAYLARRALDYLIGFNISPLLWKKLPGCQSAGRVQSAALALLSDRELDIEKFNQQEYWTVEVELDKEVIGLDGSPTSFSAHLTHYESTRLNQLSISSHEEAKEIEIMVKSVDLKVVGCKTNRVQRNPPTPYNTSTLQQDAATKLNFSSTHIMKLAQNLYEGVQLSDTEATGLITYIRTNGQHISDDALEAIRSFVAERYGPDFAAKRKVKKVQEAHEAIRPTNITTLPSMLRGILDDDSLKLYTLIWCRTVASRMKPEISKQIQIDVGDATKSVIFRSSCARVEFLGYQAAFRDVEAESIEWNQNEGDDSEEVSRILSSMTNGEKLYLREVFLNEHHTQPPPRYSEASLVKKMEELGIGRPSTYASTLRVLQNRNYVTMKSQVLHPDFRGRMVSAFLSHYFTDVTDYGYIAKMETELDNVSAGLAEWKDLLRNYWTRFSAYCESANSVNIHQVEKMLEKKFGVFLFASLPGGNRTCPSCLEGTLIFKVSRFDAGYFIACDQHPGCKYIAKTFYGDEEDDESQQTSFTMDEPRLIGLYPSSGEKILLKKGPYGFYVQLGEDKKTYVPKRAPVSHIKDLESITVEVATELLSYPATLGNHPDDGLPVIIKLAKNGFIVRHRRTSASLPKNVDPKEVDLEKALKYLSGVKVRQWGRPKRTPKVEAAEPM